MKYQYHRFIIGGFLTVLALFLQTASAAEHKKIVLGAGCFWCVEAYYEALPGVVEVVSGYAGGTEPKPTYAEVSAGNTTHAEAVEITYDPEKISLRKLIDFFWTTHDVTISNGVAPDFGPQYRSMILFANDEEKKVIDESKKAYQASGKISKPIATEIKAFTRFHKAEGYHQDYVKNNPNDRYVQGVTAPKLKKLGLPFPKSKP